MSKLHKAHKTKHVNIKSDEEDREDKLQAENEKLRKCYKMLLDWNRVEIKTKQAHVKLIEQMLNESDVKK